MQTPLQIKLVTESLLDGQLQIARLDGREAISQLFEYELLAVRPADDDFDAEQLVGERAALIYERDEEEIGRIYGMISVVHDRFDTEGDTRSYRLIFVPRAYRLSLVETLDVFLDLSVPDLIRHKLEGLGMREGPRPQRKDGAGAPGDGRDDGEHDFELRLRDSYPTREFVVQYKETDLAFISRLCEHLGISFFFEHESGRDVMVFSDANEGFRPIAGGDVPFRARGEHRDVYRLEETIRMIPADYVVRDYNYRTPQVALTGAANVSDGTGSVVEYGSHVKTPEEAKRMAGLRAEERLSGRRVFEGTCDVATLRAGSTFRLVGHARGDVGLLVTEVKPSASQATLGHGAGHPGFQVEFKAILKTRRFRPARVTPKPRIHGVVTGVIDAASKGEYAEIDDQGRYRVKFLFDTTGPGDAKGSRLVRMAQPHAGQGYGMHFPLRPGVEVIITFMDGDPDRPIIAATVPNPQTASPVTSGNAPRNIIRTGGGNEMNIDDTKGEHRIKLSTPHMNTTFQIGYRNAPEDGAMLQTQGNQSTIAMQSANAFTTLDTAMAMIMKFTSSLRIRTVAEFPIVLGTEGATVVGELAEIGLELAESILEAREAAKDKEANDLQVTAIQKQVAAQKKWETVENGEKPSSPEYAETQAGKEAEALAGLTDAEKATFEAQKAAYEAAQAKYKADLLLYRANEERLTEARKGELTGAAAGQISYWEAEVARSRLALDGDPTASGDARKGSKRVYDEAKVAYETAIMAAQVASAKSAGKTDAEADEIAREKLGKFHGANDLTEARASFDEGDRARRSYNDKVEANEHDADAIALKKNLVHVKEASTAVLLFSDIMKLVAMAAALWDEYQTHAERAEAYQWSKGVVTPPPAALTGFKKLLHKLAHLHPITPIHTIGSAGKTRVFGEEELYMWSEKAILAGEDSVLVTSKEHLAFRTPGNAEVAAKERVLISGGTVEIRSDKKIAATALTVPSTPWIDLPQLEGEMLLEAQKKLRLVSTDKAVVIEAPSAGDGKIVLEARNTAKLQSTHGQVQIEAKETAFLDADDQIQITAKKNAYLESTDRDVQITAKKNAFFTSSEGNVHIRSSQKATLQSLDGEVAVEGETKAYLGSHTQVVIAAPNVTMRGKFEVAGALLVKGDFAHVPTPDITLALRTNLQQLRARLAGDDEDDDL